MKQKMYNILLSFYIQYLAMVLNWIVSGEYLKTQAFLNAPC